MMIPDASVACTAMNPDDLPISFTIPIGTVMGMIMGTIRDSEEEIG
jgi:hypothetical protein